MPMTIRTLVPSAAISFIAALSLLASSLAAEARGEPLKAGAATSNITPWLGTSLNGGMSDRKANEVHDEMHARALVLSDGASEIAIVVCDLCMFPREAVHDAKARIQKATGIAPHRVLISATHTHEAGTTCSVFQSDPDPKYVEFVVSRVADAVVRARNHLTPAQIGWGVGSNDRQVFNRRWLMKPDFDLPNPFGGKDKVRMNPPVGHPDLIEPAGPIDPQVPIVSLKSQAADGRHLAVLANYALHYVGDAGGGGVVSADYFGYFADMTQAKLGADRQDPPFVGIMSNGTSGDINNINFRQARPATPPYGRMKQVAEELSDEAVRVIKGISYRDEAKLDSRLTAMKLGIRKPTSAEIQQAEAIVAKADGNLRTSQEIYAGETLDLAEYPDSANVDIQAIRIGDLAIVAIPCEVFVEIGLAIKKESPFQPTFLISLANGYHGYLPTAKHHELGGYETWRAKSSHLEVEAAAKIQQTALELLKQLKTAGH